MVRFIKTTKVITHNSWGPHNTAEHEAEPLQRRWWSRESLLLTVEWLGAFSARGESALFPLSASESNGIQ